MEQEAKRFTEQNILEKIRLLEPHQISEVIDFIEFLSEKKQKESYFLRLLNETSEPTLDLDDVRRRLAKIPGKMSETIREMRDERG